MDAGGSSNGSVKGKTATATTNVASTGFSLPVVYSLFFLVVEPAAALVGAFYAHFRPDEYLQLTHADSAVAPTPLGTSIALSQLANLYLLFALNEALVLRSTGDLRVWKTVLSVLLIADVGHLYTVHALGSHVYFDVANWNAIDWGNVPFVYGGAAMRIMFLSGIGLGKKKPATAAATTTKKSS